MMNKRDPAMTEEQAAIQALKEAGVDYDSIQQEVQDKQKEENTKLVVTQMKDVLQGTNEAPAQGITEKLGKGAMIGLMDVVRNVYNGGVSLANYAEDFAASKGLGSGDLITEATKWENPYKDQKLDTETEVARRVVQYATPVLGGLATSGIKAGLALEAAYSFFAIDPDEQRVSDLLKDTRMAEVPIASEIIDSLSTKPDDTEIESRLKNLAEGMGLAVPLTGMVWGAGKVYAGLRKAKTEKLLDAAVAEKQAAKMTPAEVDASDVKISKVPIEDTVNPVDLLPPSLQDDVSNGLLTYPEAFKKAGIDDSKFIGGAVSASKSSRPKNIPEDQIHKYVEPPPAGTVKVDRTFSGPRLLEDITNLDRLTDEDVSKLPTETIRAESAGTEPFAVIIKADRKEGFTRVVAKNEFGEEIGMIMLHTENQGTKKVLASHGTQVWKEYQKTGVGSAMYNYANKYIGDLFPSKYQTPAGKAFTTRYQLNKLRGSIDPDTGQMSIGFVDNFEKEWKTLEWDQPAVKVEADTVKVNLSDDNIVDFFNNIARSTDNVKKYRGPITDVETKQAVDLMRKNPAVVEKIAKWTPDQGALTSEELLVGKYILAKSDKALTESILKAEIDSSPEMQVKVQRDFDNYLRIKQIEQGVSSEGGRVLRANQILGTVSGLGDKEAMKQLGAQGRKKMYDRIIEKYGGVEGVKKNLEKVKLIQELAKVAKTPDEAFRVKMGEVAVLSTMDKVEDAVTKVALNGMLSSPKTWVRATVGNFLMTSKNLVDNYISVGIGKTREMFGGSKSAMDFAEANARLKSALWGTIEGIIPAAKSFANKKSPLYGTAKFEVTSDIAAIPDLDDVGVKQGFEWVNDNGIVVNALTAGEIPRRALISIDTYFSHINFKSNLAGELVALQKQGKFLKPDEIEKFWQEPHVYAPQAYYNSRKAAGVSTFSNGQVEGTLGYSIVNGLESAADSIGVPFKRVVTPFLNTSVNIARATEEMTPLAGFRLLAKRGSLYRALEKGGREADMAMAKLASGTSAIIATMMLLDSEDLVPGQAATADQRALNKSFPAGKDIPAGPAVKVGDKFYSLQGLEPFSTIINAASRLKTMSGLVSEEEYLDAANTFRLLVQDAVSPEEYTQGLSELINIVSGDTDPSKGIAGLVTRFMPLSGALATAKEVTDPNKRDSTPTQSSEDGVLGSLQELTALINNRIKSRAPMMSGDLPMQRNFFGRAVKVPDGLGPDFMSPIAASDGKSLALKRGLENVIKFSDNYTGKLLGVTDFNVSMPGRVIEVPVDGGPMGKPQAYQMTPEEYSDYLVIRNGLDPMTGQLLAGRSNTLEGRYYEILDRYNMFDIKPQDLFRMDDKAFGKMVHELKTVTNVYNEAAKNHMIGVYEDGAIKKKMEDAVEKWKTNKIPGIE